MQIISECIIANTEKYNPLSLEKYNPFQLMCDFLSSNLETLITLFSGNMQRIDTYELTSVYFNE